MRKLRVPLWAAKAHQRRKRRRAVFADDVISLDVGVNWSAALPAYFNCLAKVSSSEEFARTMGEAIADLVDYDRPWFTDAASEVACAEQRAALVAPVPTRK